MSPGRPGPDGPARAGGERWMMVTAPPLLGTIGAAAFVVVFVADGATRAGYDPVRHTVSALALGTRGWLQTANFVVCGALVTVAATGLLPPPGGPWLALVVAVFGVGLIASGLFAMDPMRGYPPGTPAGDPATVSRAHRWHDQAGAVVFGGLPVAAVVAAVTLDATPWRVGSAVVAVHLAVAAARFAAAWEADDPRTGRLQRAFIVPGWAWLAALCWHLQG